MMINDMDCKLLRRLLLAVASLMIAVASLTAQPAFAADSDQEWITLFDGSSLDHWRGYNADDVPAGWEIQGDALVRTSAAGDLITRDKFESFQLGFEWKISERGNSGVMYRVAETNRPSYFTGPEYQVLDNRGNNQSKHSAGALYDLYAPTEDTARPAGEWNQARIVVDGDRVEHWLNGKKVVETTIGGDDWNRLIANSKFATWSEFGKHAQGHIALQDHGNRVWYRHIRIKPLKGDKADKTSAQDRPVRILLVTQSAGFRHPTVTRKATDLSHTEQIMTELGIRSGEFRIDCTQDVETDFRPELIENYDIVMFYTTGDLPIPEDVREWFLNTYLKEQGHGFLGVHSAADTYHNYQPYWDMIGGTFDGHPWGAGSTVTIKVHDQSHPAARPWGEQVTLQDEIYQFKNWQPEKVRVLMSLDMEQTELKKPYHVPILWVKEYGNGRVMHMSLGHREDVWSNPTYQESLVGGIRWLAGKETADASPNPELDARENELARRAAE